MSIHLPPSNSFFFFFNDTATTEIYTLSLHDALPISIRRRALKKCLQSRSCANTTLHCAPRRGTLHAKEQRSEEHTSELQSQSILVCRLLLEKKKKKQTHTK